MSKIHVSYFSTTDYIFVGTDGKCTLCYKVNCICDDEYEQWHDNQLREESYDTVQDGC